jgi:hypothetical protein
VHQAVTIDELRHMPELIMLSGQHLIIMFSWRFKMGNYDSENNGFQKGVQRLIDDVLEQRKLW